MLAIGFLLLGPGGTGEAVLNAPGKNEIMRKGEVSVAWAGVADGKTLPAGAYMLDVRLTDTDGNSNTTNYSYACSDAYLTRTTLPVTTNGSSLQTTTSYDCSSGLVTATQDGRRRGAPRRRAHPPGWRRRGKSAGFPPERETTCH